MNSRSNKLFSEIIVFCFLPGFGVRELASGEWRAADGGKRRRRAAEGGRASRQKVASGRVSVWPPGFARFVLCDIISTRLSPYGPIPYAFSPPLMLGSLDLKKIHFFLSLPLLHNK